VLTKEGYTLLEFILDKWKQKGTISDEEQSKLDFEMMLSLYFSYRLECLVKTLHEIDNYVKEFDDNI
jgi:hypothetical protein